MNLGIGISNIGFCVCWRTSVGIRAEMEFGFDLTKPSWLSATDIERLKKHLDQYAGFFSTEIDDLALLSNHMEIVVSHPVGLDLVEFSALKALFQRMNIKVKRFIDSGMARGLFASQEDFCGNICCVGCNRGSVELTILNIDDGMVEALCHHVYQDDTEWDFARMDQTIAKLAGEYGGVETVLLHYTKPPKQEQACAQLRCAPRTVRLDDAAAGGGVLVQAEVLEGKMTDLLALNLSRFGIHCMVEGNEMELLACDDSIPARRSMEIEVGANRSVALELVAISNGTGKRTSIYKKTLAPQVEKRTVKVEAAVDANLDIEISIAENEEIHKITC